MIEFSLLKISIEFSVCFQYRIAFLPHYTLVFKWIEKAFIRKIDGYDVVIYILCLYCYHIVYTMKVQAFVSARVFDDHQVHYRFKWLNVLILILC